MVDEPVVQEDGRLLVSYDFNIENTGQTQLDNIQLTDDLGDVFGDANVAVSLNEIASKPAAYVGNENDGYNGVSDINVLDGIGSLEPGEALNIQVQALVRPQIASTFINRASAAGSNPLTGDPVLADDRAAVELIPAANVDELIVIKSARPQTVQIGDPVLYTIDVTNPGIETLTDINIVDNIPAGFSYVPNSATLSDATSSVDFEPVVTAANGLSWSLSDTEPHR